MIEAKGLLSNVITKLAEDAAKTLANKAKDYLVDRESKEQIDFGYAYEEYLYNVYNTYSKSKTILYDDEAKKLSSFYVPADLSQWTGANKLKRNDEKERISAKSINSVLEQGDKLIVTGIGGMGKTMLMKHFCIDAIESEFAIPVFVSLRRFNNIIIDGKTIEEMIYDQLKIFGFALDYKYFEYSLSCGKYVFLLDGYDEIAESRRSALSFGLADFAKRYSSNRFVISSRPIDELFSWEEFKVFSICSMNHRQAVKLIWKLDFDNQLKKRFIKEFDEKLYNKYESFASVPLLFSILFLTYASNTTLPETLNEFYEKAFETLLYKHDRKKMGFERILKSKLSYGMFREVFLRFCALTYFDEVYSFSYKTLVTVLSEVSQRMRIDVDEDAYVSDLVDISCMIIHEGQDYIFIHRSFQEYFAACYLAKKTDAEQREFCSGYLNEEYEEGVFKGGEYQLSYNEHTDLMTSCPHYFHNHEQLWKEITELAHYEFMIIGLHKIWSFFVMLNSIEPDRFENIVLMPIMEKVYSIYKKENKDLENTFIKCFEVVYYPLRNKSSYSISLNELSTLVTFMGIIDIGVIEIMKDDTCLIQQLEKTDFKNSVLSSKPFSAISGETESDIEKLNTVVFKKLMWILVTVIIRYERLCNQKTHNRSFIELKKTII